MVTSKKISPERIQEIMNFPVTYDKDCPKLTADQIARMKPARINSALREVMQTRSGSG